MNDYRFKIERRTEVTWDLFELRSTRDFFKRDGWEWIGAAPTKAALEEKMRKIIEDETKVAPTYYTRGGHPVPNF
jgi:hypothetical protein